MRKLPSEEVIGARAPGGERSPEPHDSERVVFDNHFIVGFGLPVSSFLRHFLNFYSLQMHHLGLNSVLYIACFVTLCEACMGFRPFMSFFRHLFYFRAQMHGQVAYSCGGTMVYKRLGRPLPKMTWKESFKKWQRTFFYVREIVLDVRPWRSLALRPAEHPHGPNLVRFLPDREESNDEEYESDGDGPNTPEGSGTPEAEEDEGDEGDEVDKPVNAPAGEAESSRHPPEGSDTDWTDDDTSCRCWMHVRP
ncbi:hypothetical protein D1007_35339 [Hordeum vulgare]|nr:hypothetical protein D1007_35339 [Hordeum vulgare]